MKQVCDSIDAKCSNQKDKLKAAAEGMESEIDEMESLLRDTNKFLHDAHITDVVRNREKMEREISTSLVKGDGDNTLSLLKLSIHGILLLSIFIENAYRVIMEIYNYIVKDPSVFCHQLTMNTLCFRNWSWKL